MALMSLKNLTIGIRDDGISIKIDNILNKITGSFGFYFDRLFVHKNNRDCILKSVKLITGVDSSSGNKSFFHLVRKNLVDIYYLPIRLQYDEKYFEETKITSVDQFQLGQFLPKPTKFQQTDLSSFLLNNKNLLSLILIGYLIISLFYFIFTNQPNCRKIKILNIKFYNLVFLNNNQLKFLSFKFSLVKLFFNLFLFINLVLLINTIKTDKVIVKTDHFLNTDDKLIETDKKFIFSLNNEDKYRLLPKQSLMYKLYERKMNEKNYFPIPEKIDKKASDELSLLTRQLTSFFVIGGRSYILYSLASISSYSKNEFIYLNNQNYFELPLSFYLRKSLNKEIKNKIHWGTNQYFENGIYAEFESNLHNEMYKFINDLNVLIIFNMKQYIDEQSNISSFELENFKTIFIFYILILFIIFSIFIVNLIYKKIFKILIILS